MIDISTASKEDTTDAKRASDENTVNTDQAKGDSGQGKGKKHCYQQGKYWPRQNLSLGFLIKRVRVRTA